MAARANGIVMSLSGRCFVLFCKNAVKLMFSHFTKYICTNQIYIYVFTFSHSIVYSSRFCEKNPIDDCLTFCTVYLGDVIYRHGTGNTLHNRVKVCTNVLHFIRINPLI